MKPLKHSSEKYTVEYCEQQYNARAAIPDHARIFTRWQDDAAIARRTIPGLFNLNYSDGSNSIGAVEDQTLDFFPARQANAPLLVFIHGGYWRALDKSDFSWLAPPYIQRGAAVAMLNYGLAPKTPIEDIVRQCLQAIAWLYRRADVYGFDANKIIVMGHSAGAHLTAMLTAAIWPQLDAQLPKRMIQGAVAVSGIYDLEPLLYAPFVNQDLRLDLQRARLLSPIYLSPATDAPLVTASGGLESDEFQRQTQLLNGAWHAHTHITQVAMPQANHLTVCDLMAQPEHPIFQRTCELLQLA